MLNNQIELIANKYPAVLINDFIVESKNPIAIETVSKFGLNSSYYLPSSLKKNNELISCKEMIIEQVIKNINNYRIKMISFPISQSNVVTRCILPFVSEVDIASWSGSIENIIDLDINQYEVFMVDHYTTVDEQNGFRSIIKGINNVKVCINRARSKLK